MKVRDLGPHSSNVSTQTSGPASAGPLAGAESKTRKAERSVVREPAADKPANLVPAGKSKRRKQASGKGMRIPEHEATRKIPGKPAPRAKTEGPKQCFRCMAWGHLASTCKEAQACRHCAGPHRSSECQDKSAVKCALCLGPHRASSPACKEAPSRPRPTPKPKGGRRRGPPLSLSPRVPGRLGKDKALFLSQFLSSITSLLLTQLST